jgi:hypothetical protein
LEGEVKLWAESWKIVESSVPRRGEPGVEIVEEFEKEVGLWSMEEIRKMP